MKSDPLKQLRSVILDDQHPFHERQAALTKFEDSVGRSSMRRLRTVVTRSARISGSRQGIYINELDRLELYAQGKTIGEILTAISRVLFDLKAQPTAFDFGWNENRGPVVSVSFLEADAPEAYDLRSGLVDHFPSIAVTKAGRQPSDEKKLLLFLDESHSK